MQKEYKKIARYLSTVLDYRDYTLAHHDSHLRKFTEVMLRQIEMFFPEYKLTDDEIEKISYAALLHDVGKIAVPDRVLQKPGRLTQDEFEMLKTHTRKGKKICEALMKQEKDETVRDFLKCSAQICIGHHERYDGTGYPDGLVGEEVPLAAQVVGLADAYDALVSDRIRKRALTKEQAFEMIVDGDCGVFSPRLLEVFQMVRMRLEFILDQDK